MTLRNSARSSSSNGASSSRKLTTKTKHFWSSDKAGLKARKLKTACPTQIRTTFPRECQLADARVGLAWIEATAATYPFACQQCPRRCCRHIPRGSEVQLHRARWTGIRERGRRPADPKQTHCCYRRKGPQRAFQGRAQERSSYRTRTFDLPPLRKGQTERGLATTLARANAVTAKQITIVGRFLNPAKTAASMTPGKGDKNTLIVFLA